MRSSRRRLVRTVSDEEVLAHPGRMRLLRAVADGRVVRGPAGGETSIFADHVLDGESVRLQLQSLAKQELIELPISGPPTLAPRGKRLLRMADATGPPTAPGTASDSPT